MSEVKHLAEVLENHFTSPKTSSFAHFVIVSDGLTGKEAAQVPGERLNSIWAVTNHIAFWMDETRAALRGDTVDLAAWGLQEVGGGWPPLGPITDANWQSARQRALDCCHALAATIRTLDDAALEQPVPTLSPGLPYQAILAIYSHNSHHTAEILTIRHILGLWVEHEWT